MGRLPRLVCAAHRQDERGVQAGDSGVGMSAEWFSAPKPESLYMLRRICIEKLIFYT